MKHLTDEELIGQYYDARDGVAGQSDAAQQHLEVCQECTEAYAALGSDLAEMRIAEVPVRDAAYGERVWASLAGRLTAYEGRKRSWLRGATWMSFGYAAACAALLAAAFVGGRLWERREAQIVAGNRSHPGQQAPGAHPAPRVVVVVLSDHLDRSERLLVELKHADADNAEMVSPLRDEARSLLTANRICRKNVKEGEDPALATALDHLDRLLAEMANQPGGLNKESITRLQDEMNQDGLLFEVRVLRSRIPDAQSAGANSAGANGSKGGIL
jgi:hypothetical protein